MIVKNTTKEMKLNFSVKISNYTFKKNFDGRGDELWLVYEVNVYNLTNYH